MTTQSPIGVVSHYNLLERLESAGPGELYRARDLHHGRTVAVRILPATFAPDAAKRAAFVERARSLIAFSHANVSLLYDVGEQDGRVYVVFEYLQGQPLRAEMAGRPVNVRRALEIAIQITDAVADVHGAGFLHSGLSPESIVITAKGHAKVPAFELAARTGLVDVSGDVRLHDYPSPEESRGEPTDERGDIYSVGAILYEMLTARRPSARGASAPSASNPHVPKELDAVVLKAIAPNVAIRHESATAFAADLRKMAALVDVREVGDDRHSPKEGPSAMSLMMIGAITLVVFLGLLYWFTRS
jgi:serine/threonine-protein kinase